MAWTYTMLLLVQDDGADPLVPMDAAVWRNTRQELLEKVRLPLASVMRFRTVCTSWRILLCSDAFLQKIAPLPQGIILGGRHGIDQNRQQNFPRPLKLYKVPMPFLPLAWGYHLLASSGGLVALLGDGVIVICNPLTGKCRALPELEIGICGKVKMAHLRTDRSSGSYRLVIGCIMPNCGSSSYTSRRAYFSLRIFDSSAGRWNFVLDIARDALLKDSSVLLDDGVLLGVDTKHPEKLIEYRLHLDTTFRKSTGSSRELEVVGLSPPMWSEEMLELHGSPFLKGNVGLEHKLQVWKLDEVNTEWVAVLMGELCDESQFQPVTEAKGLSDHIFMNGRSSTGIKVVSYNVTTNFWHDWSEYLPSIVIKSFHGSLCSC